MDRTSSIWNICAWVWLLRDYRENPKTFQQHLFNLNPFQWLSYPRVYNELNAPKTFSTLVYSKVPSWWRSNFSIFFQFPRTCLPKRLISWYCRNSMYKFFTRHPKRRVLNHALTTHPAKNDSSEMMKKETHSLAWITVLSLNLALRLP